MTEDPRTTRTAGIIIIGNEILSGKVRDSNSFYLASELRDLGVSVMRISVIPDEIETIGREASLFSKSYDYVFTSGGVGPTHDDITMAGIAQGFAVGLVSHPLLEGKFRNRYGECINDAVMKMTEVPDGANLVDLGDKSFPLVSFRNIFIFPGIPEYLKKKFSSIKERFRCSSFYLKRLFLNSDESDIAAILNAVVAGNKEVSFGSYPVVENPEYKIMITIESKSETPLHKAVEELLRKLPGEMVIRIE
jgi:molybdenum cofactor synthesis domain-containing protein